jgi:hypothetical protein
MHEPRIAAELLHVFERVPADASGALVREQSDGTMAGALLVEHGRVCWAMSRRYPRRLTDILVDEGSASTAQLDEVFALCRREHRPLGETLIARGMVSLPVLHRALLRHTCEALECLVRDEAAPWSWVAHSGYGYHPMLTFSAAEVLAGIRAIIDPPLAARALARLTEVVGSGLVGFAVERGSGARLPLAQIGCDGIELATLTELAAQADEAIAVAATAELHAAITELDGCACAAWNEGHLLFVLLCEGDLAFNRLVAQVAAMTTQT